MVSSKQVRRLSTLTQIPVLIHVKSLIKMIFDSIKNLFFNFKHPHTTEHPFQNPKHIILTKLGGKLQIIAQNIKRQKKKKL